MLSLLANDAPFAPANRLSPVLDRLFEGVAARGWPTRGPALWESTDAVHFEMDVPGATEQDVDIAIHGDELIVCGERKVRGRSGDDRSFGRFETRAALPCGVDADRVEATLANGVLSITCPKSEAAKPRKIALKSA
ncbi:Hsp20/alpha crystallin family protein [Limnoglobus roseus]|uniref:Hsp20/alpha crystallin family protein n=1 Tax=Limnoglobus roseus TaxID=2598579 RepID=A0A5C1AN67_9BACT|nr:Hsp20/alpha crystallin family protein [Limnoglobus roseus]QEL20430.1 Hsp20/alpha crystallin family protein [Limnoglobus roseus]